MAKRKTLFDDRPIEIAELTYVIKQDLSSLNSQISSLQSLSKSHQAQISRNTSAEQEGENNKNVGRFEKLCTYYTNIVIDCCPPTRQAGRCRCQLQRSPRSTNQKYPSLPFENRKFCIISILTFTTLSRHPTIRIPTIQYPYKVPNASTGLPKLKSRHSKPRSIFKFRPNAKWSSV